MGRDRPQQKKQSKKLTIFYKDQQQDIQFQSDWTIQDLIINYINQFDKNSEIKISNETSDNEGSESSQNSPLFKSPTEKYELLDSECIFEYGQDYLIKDVLIHPYENLHLREKTEAEN